MAGTAGRKYGIVHDDLPRSDFPKGRVNMITSRRSRGRKRNIKNPRRSLGSFAEWLALIMTCLGSILWFTYVLAKEIGVYQEKSNTLEKRVEFLEEKWFDIRDKSTSDKTPADEPVTNKNKGH